MKKVKVKLINHTINPEELITSSAKLCYSPVGIDEIQKDLTEEKVKEFIEKLNDIGHESPLEHVTFTFAVEGVSRTLTHQLVRHRIGCSYSQQSQRYVKLDQFEYIIPPAIERIPEAKNIFIKAMENDQKAYDGIVLELMVNYLDSEFRKIEYLSDMYYSGGATCKKQWLNKIIAKSKENKILEKLVDKYEKKAIEDARYIFPNACETKIVFTMNARSLLNFFKDRCCNRAQWEIRGLANEMLELVKEVAPTVFKYAGASCIRGKCPEGSMSCKKY